MHFSAYVLGPNPQELLAPYDENLKIEEHIDKQYPYELTLSQAKDYAERINYSGPSDTVSLLTWYTDGDWRSNDKGGYDRWTTANDQGRWDWWTVGGRFTQKMVNRAGLAPNEAILSDLDLDTCYVPFCLILPDGRWVGGSVWRLRSDEEQEVWELEARAVLRSLPGDTPVTLVDVHD